MTMKYLAIGSNPKTAKSDLEGEYLTAIMYMAPADTVEGINVCPTAELAGCKSACLYGAGRGAMSNVQQARIRKTVAFRDDSVAFVDQLGKDIEWAQRKANRDGVKLAVRLNGTSDIAWEHQKGSNGLNLMDTYPEVQFYDYTKLPNRKVPTNYQLTVSYSEANLAYALKASKTTHNIAVVFEKDLPDIFLGRRVVDGDKNDLRFLDPANVIVGLKAKGPAKKDTTGFVIRSYKAAIEDNIIAIAA